MSEEDKEFAFSEIELAVARRYGLGQEYAKILFDEYKAQAARIAELEDQVIDLKRRSVGNADTAYLWKVEAGKLESENAALRKDLEGYKTQVEACQDSARRGWDEVAALQKEIERIKLCR